jgi:hypothetical protein
METLPSLEHSATTCQLTSGNITQGRSPAEILGSTPTGGMNVCLL